MSSKDTLYEDNNRKDEKHGSQYDRFRWGNNDKNENRSKHSHEWVDTYTTEQGYHGENTSNADKSWSGRRWNKRK